MKYRKELLALSCCMPLVACSKLPEKPNIIWIMAEDIGQDLACYGVTGIQTPNLDRLAAEGVQFNSAVCTCPISSPSRSAMMTGVHQNVIGAHNHRSNRDVPLDPSVQPITVLLREQGYTCVLGHPDVKDTGSKTDCNFKSKARGPWNGTDQFGLFDRDLEYSKDNEPFFAQIQLQVTHRGDHWKSITAQSPDPVDPAGVELPPYLPDDPKIRAQYASYLDQVEYMDREVGMLMEDLDKKDLLDHTIIFFIGDNGRCEVKGKGYLYEPGLKVPMIAWGRGIRPDKIQDLVSTLDISATILDLAGCEMPDYLMGKPLFDKVSGTFIGGHDYLYSARDNWDEVIDCSRAVTTTDYKYIRNYMPEKGWEVHQQYLDFHRPAVHILREWQEEGRLDDVQQLFMADHKPAEELYDLRSDPYELDNLADDPLWSGVLSRMRAYMEDWQSRYRDRGLEDMDSRSLEKMPQVREYVKTHHPEYWKKLTEGEIGDRYKDYAAASRQAR